VWAGLLLGLLTSAVLYKNLVTFGSLTGLPSLKYHVQMMANPERLARTGGSFLQPGNVRTMVYNVLNPNVINFRPSYPFLFAKGGSEVLRFPESKLDWTESHWSLTGGYPFWCLLALGGLLLVAFPRLSRSPRVARFRLPIVASLAAGCTLLVSSAITQRYLHDVFPFLLVAGAVGFEGLRHVQRDVRWTRSLVPLMVLLAVYTCYASLALSSPGWQG
jgi:hypothetical protein